ncbi:MAG: hypothetical protein NC043_01170 [Muribaculaceae bacterium]|nr:hypothetical protein [Muribaculaceae bacterium]
MKHKVLTILILALSICATSCSDSTDEPDSITLYQDIVTFTGCDDTYSYFEFQVIDDSPVVRLTSKGTIDTQATPPGSRLFFTYSPDGTLGYGESGTVTTHGLSRIYEVTLALNGSTDTSGWDTEPIGVTTLWRSGQYINLIAQVTNTERRSFYIIPDAGTLGSPTPRLYITTQSTAGSAAGYQVRTAASFDISSIWEQADIEGVEVWINNTANPNRQKFTFKK